MIGGFKKNTSSVLFAFGDFTNGWELLADKDDCLNSIEHAIECGNGLIDVIDGYLIARTFN